MENNLYLTDEDIHGCEDDSNEVILMTEIKKLKEKIGELEDELYDLKSEKNG